LQTFPFVYNLSKRELYDKVIEEVLTGEIKDIQPDVYRAYSDNLRKAVAGVLSSDEYGDKYFDLQAQLLSNVSRFAAYKAYHLTEQLKRQRDKWPDDDDYKKVAKAVLNTFNRYQAAEYNTATARARTAKQWTDFNADPIANELYPNLKWTRTRSANPRELHLRFAGLVLPKNDPFWLQNQPGNLWNCKCDWEETDDPTNTNDLPPDELDGYRSDGGGIHANGLNGNPAETGEVFTDQCTYFKQAGKNRKVRDEVEKKCMLSNSRKVRSEGKDMLIEKKSNCIIGDKQCEVVFIPKGIEHYAHDMFNEKSLFWIKNEILPNIDNYIPKAKCVGRKPVDTQHNTRKETVKLKQNTDYFYYFTITLPTGDSACLHLGRYKEGHVKEGKLYLYSIGKNIPKNIETI